TGKTHLADDLHSWAAERGQVLRQEVADWSAVERDALRRCDLLVVEDLQHLSTRAADEFAAVLDDRIARRRATLLTASQGPAELANLPPRLMSRLSGGLVVGLQSLGIGSRHRFLKKRAVARGMALDDNALDWLARHTRGSGRQLLAALEQARLLSA